MQHSYLCIGYELMVLKLFPDFNKLSSLFINYSIVVNIEPYFFMFKFDNYIYPVSSFLEFCNTQIF